MKNLACLAPTLLLALSACKPATTAPVTTPAASAAALPTGAVNPVTVVNTYVCEDGQQIRAGYTNSETAVVDYKGHAYTLKIARSGSGARYTGMGLQWWTKGMTQGSLAQLKPGEDIASEPGVACAVNATDLPPVEPPAPGSPGGLPDDRTPVSEAHFGPKSPQAAANVVQTYYGLLGEGKTAEAAKLTGDAKPQDLSPYAAYHALVGAPGDSEGAAGSIFIEVPVVIYGRLKTGEPLHQSGKVTLRRVNDVDGATSAQLRWHIVGFDLKP